MCIRHRVGRPNHVALAESLGYRRAWLYDSPAVITDVWMTLARCAERTTRIGLGPGVLVPSLRHPMVNASAIAELATLAPGRVAVAVGTGFTGRLALGHRPIRWSDVADYVRCLKTLLAGETAEWEGARIRTLQLPGFGAPRPLRVPLLIAADGSRGRAVATELADGVFSAASPADRAWRPESTLPVGVRHRALRRRRSGLFARGGNACVVGGVALSQGLSPRRLRGS